MNAGIIAQLLGEPAGAISRLSGGDINEVYAVQSAGRAVVIKLNRADLFPDMLRKEAQGLRLLAASKSIKTPDVIGTGILEDMQYLLLEKIETRSATTKFWEEFGYGLAKLHQHSAPQFGLDHDNYIGSLVQVNKPCSTWSEFLVTQRLQPMVEMAVNQGDINYVEARVFEDLYARIDQLFPVEQPSLLHGDLWSGNYLSSATGEAVLIDPAVYYGHREMDIGMMHLFGGFPAALFDAYNEVHPLEKGWKERIPLNQLYPLLVHVNLFGRSYWAQISRILSDLR